MKIFEAYDKPAVRLSFKEYIEAEGITVSKREQIYTRFGTYMSRIRGVGFDKFLLEANDENDFKSRLDTIFLDKWKNHLGYPEIPAYFYRYLDFLHRQRALNDDFDVDGLNDDNDCRIESPDFSRYEIRFLSEDGKLRILANPLLIRKLKDAGMLKLPVEDIAVEMCRDFYESCQLNMTTDDWVKIIDEVSKPQKKSGKRGDITYELKFADSETKICNSYQALESIVCQAGIEKVAQCNLRLNGQPLIARRIPKDKENSFTYRKLKEGYYINNMGKPMDRYKVMRILISMYRLPMEINLSKDKATKSGKSKKQTEKTYDIATPLPEINVGKTNVFNNLDNVPKTDSNTVTELYSVNAPKLESDFIYGENGTLNLFDDF